MKPYIFLIALAILTQACIKRTNYTPVLPEETSSGQNSLGFLHHNGIVWTSIEHGSFPMYNKPDHIPNATCLVFREINGKKSIEIQGEMRIKDANGSVRDKSDFYIGLNNMDDFSVRNFSFDSTWPGNVAIYEDRLTNTTYRSYTGNSFQLAITKLDTIQRIISGNFSGTLYKCINDRNGFTYFFNEPFSVESGRFDVKYYD